nr:isoflavone reductase like [Quercus suber]
MLNRSTGSHGGPSRENTASNPEKSKLIESFKSSGMTLLHGDIYRHESLVKAIKQVDIVISAVGSKQIADQVKIIAAIKEAGNIKRFIPSDNSNGFAGYFLPNFGHAGATAPPRGEVVIIGDGNPIGIFVKEEDIVNYTIKAVDDPRTLNKVLYLKTPANNLSFNEIVSLWEKKIGKTLEKIYLLEDQLLKKIQEVLPIRGQSRNNWRGKPKAIFAKEEDIATYTIKAIVSIWEKKIGKTLEKTYLLEDQLLKKIQESSCPFNLLLSIAHSAFVKGNLTKFEIKASFGMEASELYPEVKYTTMDEYLDQSIYI